MAGVGDEAHLGAVRLVDPVQHGVDGLGQGAQLLLGGGQVDAAVQVLGVDLLQLPGQGLQLLAGHVGHGAEAGGGGSQILKGAQHLADGAVVAKQAGEQEDALKHQHHNSRPVQGLEDAGQVDRDGVGGGLAGHLNLVIAA